MKKNISLISLLCILAIVFGLVACSKTTESTDSTTTDTPNSTTIDSTTTESQITNPITNEDHVHSFDEGVVTKEATCDETGTMTFTCSCGETKTEVVPALGHNFGEWVAEVPATFSSTGTKGYKTCDRCNKSFDADGNEITEFEIPVATELTIDFNNPNRTTDNDGRTTSGAFLYGGWNGREATKDGVTVYELFANNNTDPTMWFHTFNHELFPVGSYEISFVVLREFDDFNTNAYFWYRCITDGDVEMPKTQSVKDEMNNVGTTEWATIKTSFYIDFIPNINGIESMQFHYTCPTADNGSLYIKSITIKKVDSPVLGEWVDEVPATCTETGTRGYYPCTNYDKYFDANKNVINAADLVIPVLGHNFGEWVAEVPATCTETGTKGYKTCTRCNKNFDADNNEITDLTITALGHNYGAWVDEVPATCTETGTKGYKTCTRCNKNFDADNNEIADLTITALGHDLVDDAAIPATCTETGKTAGHHCTRCDYTDGGETVPALGHDFEWVIDKEATYTETGLKHEKCTRCDEVRNENTVIDMISHEHNLTSTAAVAATCTEAGSKAYYTCTVCGKYFSDAEGQLEIADLETYLPVAALGHNFGAWVAVVPATCTETGTLGHKTCDRCNKNFAEDDKEITNLTIAALGHNLVDDAAVAPTCTENGKTAGHHCTRCDYTDGGETVPALGHNFGAWVDGSPATFLSTGTIAHKTCDRCNKNFDADDNEIANIIIPVATELTLDFNNPSTVFEFGGWNTRTTTLDGITVYELFTSSENTDPTMWLQIKNESFPAGTYEFTVTAKREKTDFNTTSYSYYEYNKSTGGTGDGTVDTVQGVNNLTTEYGTYTFTISIMYINGAASLKLAHIHYTCPKADCGSMYIKSVKIEKVADVPPTFNDVYLEFNGRHTESKVVYNGFNTDGVHALDICEASSDPAMWGKVNGLEAGKKYNFAITLYKAPNYPASTNSQFKYIYYKNGGTTEVVVINIANEVNSHNVCEFFTVNCVVDLTVEGCTGLESFHVHTDDYVQGKYNEFISMLMIDKIVVTEIGGDSGTRELDFNGKTTGFGDFGGWTTEYLYELRADQNNCDPTMHISSIENMALGKYQLTFAVLKTFDETVNTPRLQYNYFTLTGSEAVSIDLTQQFAEHSIGEWFDVTVVIDLSMEGCRGLDFIQLHYAQTWEANRYSEYHGSIFIRSIKVKEITE